MDVIIHYTDLKTMQNDIEIEKLTQANSLKEEKLLKMKNNIEKLQLNMNRKLDRSRPNITKYPQTIYDQPDYQLKSPANTDKEFTYNSTLFKNINNESQPIMDNGSGVSNFSSVSNINHLLNANVNNLHLSSKEVHRDSQTAGRQEPNILKNIDKLLEKSKNTTKIPIKAFQKYIEIKESNESKDSEQDMDLSKISNSSGEASARMKIQEYRKLIQSLQPIEEEHNKRHKFKSKQESVLEKQFTFKITNKQAEEKSQRRHIPHISNLTNRSQYTISNLQSFRNLPPTPPPQPKKQPPGTNTVERQRALVKESFQQFKKLENKMGDNLDRSELDFQLSDQSDQQPAPAKQPSLKVRELQKQKELLLRQLEMVERELEVLESEQ